MLNKERAFKTVGDFILENGEAVERKNGLGWFDTEIKASVTELLQEINAYHNPTNEKINEIILRHFNC